MRACLTAATLAALLPLSAAFAAPVVAADRPNVNTTALAKFQDCVRQRESGGNYRAVSASGNYRGAYQFGRQWRDGLVWMLRKAHGPKAERLRQRPIHRWPAKWQDRAFVVAVTADADNWRHWYLAGSKCNQYGPKVVA